MLDNIMLFVKQLFKENKMDQQIEEKIKKHLKDNWMNQQNCPICGEYKWIIGGDIITMLKVGENKSLSVGGQVAPVFYVVCDKCAYTHYFNAVAAGVIK